MSKIQFLNSSRSRMHKLLLNP